MERVKGIEPSSQAWEAHILPLNHTRFRQHAAGSTLTPQTATTEMPLGLPRAHLHSFVSPRVLGLVPHVNIIIKSLC